jgi:hypothetical protein
MSNTESTKSGVETQVFMKGNHVLLLIMHPPCYSRYDISYYLPDIEPVRYNISYYLPDTEPVRYDISYYLPDIEPVRYR